ncbi:hypothetical protein WMF31_42180 [Sorangium sp. So ce1036]|uniref:tetratricopeptide repeat protein n=1 Tax=Sorangium sp. So ce1036 TaxID=3133328 RepID=UPI003F094002
MAQQTEAARRYERLVVELHREIRAEHDEGADAIRDAMDEPWSELTTEERGRLGWLSEDLYEIGGARRPRGRVDATRQERVELLKEAKVALLKRRFARCAELLREIEPATMPQYIRIYMLGRCWQELGFPYAGAEFFDHAYELGRRANYAAMAMSALAEAGERERLYSRIEEIERREDAEPTLLLHAAALLFSGAEGAPPSDAPALFQRVIALVERGAACEEVLPSVRAAALIAGGFSYERLGDLEKAIAAFDMAVRVHEHDAALVARGMAQLLTNRNAALADFQRATDVGTTLPWPYLYLAHDALLSRRFERLEQLCAEGVSRASTATTRAQFFEWSAIAAAELGKRPAVVLERFSRAIAEDPLEPRIMKNLNAYKATSATPEETPKSIRMPSWEPPREPPARRVRRSMAKHTIRTLAAA